MRVNLSEYCDKIKTEHFSNKLETFKRNHGLCEEDDPDLFNQFEKFDLNMDGLSLLHRAVNEKDLDSVIKLAELGFDPNTEDLDGDTPLELCIEHIQLFWQGEHRTGIDTLRNIACILIEAGADLDYQSQTIIQDDKAPLIYKVIRLNEAKLTQIFLDYGANGLKKWGEWDDILEYSRHISDKIDDHEVLDIVTDYMKNLRETLMNQ